MSWDLSRNAISLLYKSTLQIILFIITILHNCLVWASAISKKHLIASSKAILRPFSLPLVRLFKSTSNGRCPHTRQPLHLKIVKKSFLSMLLCCLVAGKISAKNLSSYTPFSCHRERLLCSELFSLWNSVLQALPQHVCCFLQWNLQ